MDFGSNIDTEILRVASLDPDEVPAYLHNLDKTDAIADYATTAAGRNRVLEFFAGITGSETIAKAIIDNSVKYRVSPSLALALAYEESKFDTRAINKNGSSVDRGLFQLNSLAFPKVKPDAAYDPDTNARYGLSHLAWFLESGGNEVAALAMYNAGQNRVDNGGTPRRTLDYIFRILTYRDNIQSLFAARVAVKAAGRIGSVQPTTKVE